MAVDRILKEIMAIMELMAVMEIMEMDTIIPNCVLQKIVVLEDLIDVLMVSNVKKIDV